MSEERRQRSGAATRQAVARAQSAVDGNERALWGRADAFDFVEQTYRDLVCYASHVGSCSKNRVLAVRRDGYRLWGDCTCGLDQAFERLESTLHPKGEQ